MRRGRVVFIAALSLFAVTGGVIAGLINLYLGDLPQIRYLEEYRPSESTRIYDVKGRLISELYVEKRKPVPLKSISPFFIKAILSVEDERFYSHVGVDIKAILRALWADLRSKSFAQGASTITQQLTRNLFLAPDKSISRKIKEAILAVQIENHYTKDEILELYCNQIYLGSGVYGVEAAAQKYFGISAGELTLPQAAVIAALPKAPSHYDPTRNPDQAQKRKAVVLGRMLALKEISPEEYQAAREAPMEIIESASSELAPFFVEHVRRYLEEVYGYTMIYQNGLEVHTSLDIDLQKAAVEALRGGLDSLRRQSGEDKAEEEDKAPLQGALVAIDPHTGRILAMVGGYDFTSSQFNRAIQAQRQPGSAIKPLIYAAAIESGYTPASIIEDSPVQYTDPYTGDIWEPQNYDEEFHGDTTLVDALTYSRNVVTIKLLNRVGVRLAAGLMRRLGIESHIDPYLSLALGTSTVNLLELTSAYTVFPNGGILCRPIGIIEIKDGEGRVLEHNRSRYEKVLDPDVGFVVLDMMRNVVNHGTGVIARSIGHPLAAKTGTTNNYQDAWFIGYSPSLAAGVWIGYDDNRPMEKGSSGARMAGPIWVDFMKKAVLSSPGEDFHQSENVVLREIDAETGLLAGPGCPDKRLVAFIRGTEPKQICSHPGED